MTPIFLAVQYSRHPLWIMLSSAVLLQFGCATHRSGVYEPLIPPRHERTAPVRTFALFPSGSIELHFIDVGQGDCTLVVLPDGKRLLVDCGSNRRINVDPILDYLLRLLDQDRPLIDCVVITHPDKDHYNLLPLLFPHAPGEPRIEIGHVVYVGAEAEYTVNSTDAWLRRFPSHKKTSIKGQEFNTYPLLPLPSLESAEIKVLAANVPGDKNTRSIVLKISHDQFDALICGDATFNTDINILTRFEGVEAELDVEVWKAAHHGAERTATKSSTWAEAIRPEAIVFSCGAGNGYGHPNIDLASRFLQGADTAERHRLRLWMTNRIEAEDNATAPFRRRAMYSTESSGTIIVSSDGRSFTLYPTIQ